MRRTLPLLLLFTALLSCAQSSPTVEPPTDNATLVHLYQLHSRLFNNVLDGITDEEAGRRISDSTNNVSWIAGHTLDIQYNLAALLGLETTNPYAGQFAFGKPFEPEADYPSLDQMRADWNTLVPRITEALGQLDAATLDAPAPFPLPYGRQTMRGVFEFQLHHLAYEIGQLGLYRRFLGKPAMSYQ